MSDTCYWVNLNVIARTKPNPYPIPYPILNLKVNHYQDVKPFLPEILSLEQLSHEQMSDHRRKYMVLTKKPSSMSFKFVYFILNLDFLAYFRRHFTHLWKIYIQFYPGQSRTSKYLLQFRPCQGHSNSTH